jgi:hypothetical protein
MYNIGIAQIVIVPNFVFTLDKIEAFLSGRYIIILKHTWLGHDVF